MKSNPTLPVIAMGFLALACSRPGPSPSEAREAPSADQADRPDLGVVMVDVGRRFETMGRAFTANRFELATFEASELAEVFTDDVPRAAPPKEGPTAQIPAMAKAFLDTVPPDLERAIASKDKATFAAAFERAAALCNACHTSAQKAFIQVPTVPGQSVPSLDPLPPPAGK